MLSKADAAGQPPTGTERRELPDALERLDGIGLSAAPLGVTGADGLFDEAEAWLRREGFLRVRSHRDGRGAQLRARAPDPAACPAQQPAPAAGGAFAYRVACRHRRDGRRWSRPALRGAEQYRHRRPPGPAAPHCHPRHPSAQHAQPGPAGDPGHGSGPAGGHRRRTAR
ncbi:hypothetical protein ACRAWF_43495 [Streptomyces sp. L7]